ncbi:protein kinase domain-containing protein [Anoxynatronum buryatiense]|uniref:Serine/threonine protein kinase n=1 Tax=Anoxynatronum buryatiense TaxID=489973 RepID=A0AA46AKP2_9CLOT|nr:protein kinase [Anoxynatronum buryatiense]SMP71402.1 Serine/threonine protein kinase [Anoxynatronum buryatiense]
MSKIFIECLSAPDKIKNQLRSLSVDIEFTREGTKGANGYLYFGENRILHTKVAVKFYYWGGDTRFHAEPSALGKLAGENILPINTAGLLDGEWAYFVTPYCQNGDLDDLLDNSCIGNIEAINRTCQILSGVGVLHAHRYVHRDLKPANIYIGDNYQSIIGDFGSVKHIPEGQSSIPASSHAVLYRPPESVETSSYGFEGDIYQCGLVLFQLLGGSLPYEETFWLNRLQRKKYDELTNEVDRAIYADQCIKARIVSGRIVDISTLPPWVPDVLKRIIRKATHIDPLRRFQSISAFHVTLNNNRARVQDWCITDGAPHLQAQPQFKVCEENGQYFVLKSRDGCNWRRDNSFKGNSIDELVKEISVRA